MNIFEMKKSDFKNIPHIRKDVEYVDFDSIIIIPTNHKHNTGYQCAEYCVVKNKEPLFILGRNCDILHLDGMCGNGFDWESSSKVMKKPWKVALLPCGYVQIWCNNLEYKLFASDCKDDFEVFTMNKERKI